MKGRYKRNMKKWINFVIKGLEYPLMYFEMRKLVFSNNLFFSVCI